MDISSLDFSFKCILEINFTYSTIEVILCYICLRDRQKSDWAVAALMCRCLYVRPVSVLIIEGLMISEAFGERNADSLSVWARQCACDCWSSPVTIVFALQGFVLIITIVREAVEEMRCFLRDKEVNSQIYSKLCSRGDILFSWGQRPAKLAKLLFTV